MHPVALFLRPVLAQYDRAAYDVFCYSNTREPTDIANEMARSVTAWRDIARLDDADAADLIRKDEIDILVDLSGHSERHRLAVFAKHPAPVQVTWMGYLDTTGLTAMDYRLCDCHTDPEGATECLHTERLVRLPDSQWCYLPWSEVAPNARLPTGVAGDVVFGSFNQFQKISKTCLDLWARILARVPDARLVVMDVRDERSREWLLARLAQRGVESDRVTLRGRESIEDYYSAIANVDIALDTFPYGATTTFDVLWTGTPIVALHGGRGLARSCWSILSSLGMPELAAHSPDAYVELTCAWQVTLFGAKP